MRVALHYARLTMVGAYVSRIRTFYELYYFRPQIVGLIGGNFVMPSEGLGAAAAPTALPSAPHVARTWRIVLSATGLILVGVGAIAIHLPAAMRVAAIESARRASIDVADQIKITRGYYTQSVVAKAISSGRLTPSHAHKGDPNGIPLPATFVKDISDLLQEKDTTLSLVSPYPWPHRADRKLDAFQSKAWAAFAADPEAAPIARTEMRAGKRILRVAVPDRMTGQACVACHNTHEKSVKRDWKVGDVRAVMEVTQVVEQDLAAAEQRSRIIVVAVAAAAGLVVVLLLLVTAMAARRAHENAVAFAELRRQNDILHQREEDLRERNRRFDAALSNMAQGLALFDEQLRVIDCNERYRQLFGLPADVAHRGAHLRDMIAHSVTLGRHPGQTVEQLISERLAVFAAGKPTTIHTRLEGPRIIETTYRPMTGGGWVATYEDITDRERAQEELSEQNRRFQVALSNMPHGLAMFDADRRLIVCNRRYVEMYRVPPELAERGAPVEAILQFRIDTGQGPADISSYLEGEARRHRDRKPGAYTVALQDGRTVQVDHEFMSSGGWVVTHQDITEATRAAAQISHLARHDALTDLANRTVFRESLEDSLKRTARGEQVAVLFLDLDQFKSVNDTLGHLMGDALLQSVATRLLQCVRETDTVARLGGDEFAIVQTGAAQPNGATALATRVIDALGAPYVFADHRMLIGTSIGIALAPEDGSSAEDILKKADLALYRAKADGRGVYRFFEPAMDAKMQARRALELDLRKALANREFELVYQPLVIVGEQRVTAFEALLRWRHPERGVVSPAEFVPLAEEIGLIGPLGAWVLHEACAAASGWPKHIKIAVNLSPLQFRTGALMLNVVSALATSGLSSDRLELEITETVMLQDTDATLATLGQLQSLGLSISMDDFGTGYSSLSYLRKFPFNKLKIDQSFVRGLSSDEESLAIIRAIIGLSRSLGMITTAEGVETPQQLERLLAEGCMEMQGFLFSQPVPVAQVPASVEQIERSLQAA
jgi:diguanylate cyclase (GGDEF)-like protein